MSNTKLIPASRQPGTKGRLSNKTILPAGIPVPMKGIRTMSWPVPAVGGIAACAAPASIKGQPVMPGQRLSRVVSYIDANLALDLCVSTLAEVAGMSSFYFCRSFKQTTGMTPHRFVLQRRMQLAKQLLQQERMPLFQIAQEIGFPDQSQFTRVFRKIVGTTPSQFRKRTVRAGHAYEPELTLQPLRAQS